MKKSTSKNTKIGLMLILIVVILVVVALRSTGLAPGNDSGMRTTDVAVTDIYWYPENPAAGQNVQVYATITNTGNVTIPSGSKIEFYLWYDGVPQPGKNYTTNTTWGMGQSKYVFLDNEVFTQGRHSIMVRIKPYFQDSNPNNNQRTETIIVSGQQYDLALYDITWTPSNPSYQNPVTINAVLQNVGTTTLPAGSKLGITTWYDGQYERTINYTLNTSIAPGSTKSLFADDETFTAGSHEIRIVYSPSNFVDPVPANNQRTETIIVSGQQNQTGSLNVTSNPTAASIYVDTVYRGLTPILIPGLTTGQHEVKATKAGYQDYITTVTIIAGQTTNLNIVLIPSGNQTDNPPTVTVGYSGPYNITNSTGTVTITAYAFDDIDLTNIKIYADDILKRTCTLSGIQTYGTCSYTGLFSYGRHTYYASATDSGGHTTQSTTGNFTIP